MSPRALVPLALAALMVGPLPVAAADPFCISSPVYSCFGIDEVEHRPHNDRCTASETTLWFAGAAIAGMRFDCGAQRYNAVMLAGWVFYNEGGPAQASAPTRCWIDVAVIGEGYRSYDVPCLPTGMWTDPGWGSVAP